MLNCCGISLLRLASLAVAIALSSTPLLAQSVLITGPKTIGPSDVTIVPTAGGPPVPLTQADIRVVGTTLTINGRHAINSLSIERSAGNVAGLVTHAAGFNFDYSGSGTDIVFGMSLKVAGDLTVQGADGSLVASAIDVTGRGYPGSQGPGASAGAPCCGGGGGAAHAGNGANGSNFAGSAATYGSVTEPSQFGSGGQNVWGYSVGGYGGGVIHLVVDGTLVIDGFVRSNGASGGGSNSAVGGGGSGGSIWIEGAVMAGSGTISTNGGSGGSSTGGGGGAGRIAIECATSAFVGMRSSQGGGIAGRVGGAGTLYFAHVGSRPLLRIDNDGLAGATTDINEPLVLDADVEIRSGARISHGTGRLTGLSLDFSGDVALEVGGSIDASGRGYAGSQGPGSSAGAPCCGGGGGAAYGGNGANGSSFVGSAATYGSVTHPHQLGSGGQNVWGYSVGGYGGGAIHVVVGGTLTVGGTVRSDGAPGSGSGNASGGGGSGGSIWIECGVLTGSGTIAVDGGTASSGGGGGAGRIAIHCDSDQFVGNRSSKGGGAVGRIGGAGTVYVSRASQRPLLRIDNGGLVGATTDINEPLVLDADFEVGPGARVSHGVGRVTGLSLDFIGDVTIEIDGSIDTAARGYASSQGPGGPAGAPCCGGGSGASHGGLGGDGKTFKQVLSTYGSSTRPTHLGSGGQNVWGSVVGGYGGGAVHLRIGGTLLVEGWISCNGTNAGCACQFGVYGGGGSGGSVWIEAGAVDGAGTLNANGGSGYSAQGGGGSGGRIAIYTCNMLMPLANVRSTGGGGFRLGGDGSIHFGSEGMIISDQTDAVAICPSGSATLSVTAAGSGPFTYQWQWKETGAEWKDVVEGFNRDSQGLASFAATDPSLSAISVDPTYAPSASVGAIESMRCIAAGVCGFVISDVVPFGFCVSDFNCDGQVEDADFVVFAQGYNLLVCDDPAMPEGCPADLNSDGFVDDSDFVEFIAAYNELGCV